MYGENLFAADVIGNTADSDGLADAAVLSGDNCTVKSLISLTVAFLDAHDDTYCVADVHFGKFGLHILLTESLYQIHFMLPPFTANVLTREKLRQRTVPDGLRAGIRPHRLCDFNTWKKCLQGLFEKNRRKLVKKQQRDRRDLHISY